ncbi:ACP S-malonyltransferase [Paenibacillus sp. GCM10012306]|uniref:ACP S-malonyltransferase n=1 Tax=Paenibacillus sp. GCM10012306 TaxID=3317342 RepID=UPI00360A2EDB
MEKLAFLFSGQGTQFTQMGKSFYENYTISRQTYEEAGDILHQDIAKLCFEGSISEMSRFTNMQFAIVTTEIAIFRAYMQDYGISPQFSVGHSIGEYAALVSSGALQLGDALRILQKRGELVERVLQKANSRMTIIENVDISKVTEAISLLGVEKTVFISCDNSGRQVAVSGLNEDMDKLEQKLESMRGIVTPLFYSPPMHSPIMGEYVDEYLAYLNHFTAYPFRFPILSNVTGRAFSDEHTLFDILAAQLTHPVQWRQSANLLYEYGITTAIEMGPKVLLTKFINEDQPTIHSFCYGLAKDRKSLAELFNNDSNFAKDKPDFVGRCLAILASTPNYNLDSKEFRKVIQNYNDIKKQHEAMSNFKFGSMNEQYREILNKLIDSLRIKQLPRTEIKHRIQMLLDETNLIYVFKDMAEAL